MSITRLSRERGTIIRCDGTDKEECSETLYTANIWAKVNRKHAATQGWSRGLRKARKRRDLCPPHAQIERELFTKQKAARQVELKRRDALRIERKKAVASGDPLPRRSRKSKSPSPQPSPSADSAPVPA